MQSVILTAILEQKDNLYNLSLRINDSAQGTEIGCVSDNYTGNTDLHNVNLYDIWKDATQAKPAVTDIGKIALQDIVNNILPKDVNSDKITFTQNFGKNYKEIKIGMKNNLKQHTKEENCIFERYNVTLRPIEECLFYFNESGIGATNAASLSSNYFTMLTAAMMSDAGPGSGDIPFPAVNHNLSIPDYIMEYFGFNKNWKWSAKIIQNDDENEIANKPYKAIYNLSYSSVRDSRRETININDMSYENVLKYSTNKNKNISLNDDITDPDYDREKYVVFKELGDSMQNASYIAFVYYMY